MIGYVTTSTDEWTDSDDASAAAIEATCERSDWSLFEIVQDHQNGKTLDRPGLKYALERIAQGQARGLVVSDLQRLTRSPHELGVLMAWFRDADARLVALDLDLDTATPAGRQVAGTLMALGSAEQGGARTAPNGGAEAPANGRPAVKDRPELMERISAMRAANMTLWQIADQFNAEGIPTLRGGSQWRPSSIQAALGYRRPLRLTACRRWTTEGATGGNGMSGGPIPTGTCLQRGRAVVGAIARPPLNELSGGKGAMARPGGSGSDRGRARTAGARSWGRSRTRR